MDVSPLSTAARFYGERRPLEDRKKPSTNSGAGPVSVVGFCLLRSSVCHEMYAQPNLVAADPGGADFDPKVLSLVLLWPISLPRLI